MPFMDPMHDYKRGRKRKLGIRVYHIKPEEQSKKVRQHDFFIHASPEYDVSSEGIEKVLVGKYGEDKKDAKIGSAKLTIREERKPPERDEYLTAVWKKKEREGIEGTKFAHITQFWPTRHAIDHKSLEEEEAQSSKKFSHTGLAEYSMLRKVNAAIEEDVDMFWTNSGSKLFQKFMEKHGAEPIYEARGVNIFALNREEMKAFRKSLEAKLKELGWSND